MERYIREANLEKLKRVEIKETSHFEQGLRVEIKEKLAPLEIKIFSQLANKCRIVERYI